MRRPAPRRRLGTAAAVALVIVAAAALVWRSPSPTSAGAIGADALAARGSGTPAAVGAAPLQGAVAQPTPPLTGNTAPSGPAPAPGRNHSAMVPTTPAAPSTLTGYVWPIAHPRLTLPFGPTDWGTRVVDGKLFHDGIDLATFCNDRITAAHDGLVLAAGRHFDSAIGWVGSLQPYFHRLDVQHSWFELPNVVVIDDGNGYRSIYAHMWKLIVRPGQLVKAGQLIGYEGMTGHATGCHLHYGLFSPAETATFGTEPKEVKLLLVPPAEIARIDPLLVLPWRPGLGGVKQSLGTETG
jgi:murein DD-endopeptidase MepM/ murein hydrolase activator NlpD